MKNVSLYQLISILTFKSNQSFLVKPLLSIICDSAFLLLGSLVYKAEELEPTQASKQYRIGAIFKISSHKIWYMHQPIKMDVGHRPRQSPTRWGQSVGGNIFTTGMAVLISMSEHQAWVTQIKNQEYRFWIQLLQE